jgi:hypothetical protein
MTLEDLERFIEDHPENLHWSSEPVTPDEIERAEEMFRWMSRH